MRAARRLLVWLALTSTGSALIAPVHAGASTWTVALAAGTGEAHSEAVPVAPSTVTATCTSPTSAKKITVTWSAVAKATSYSVYESTTSATGTYSLVASGLTGTSWPSSTLTSGKNYWFEVVTLLGTHWSSAYSGPSGESTINNGSPYCVQP